jgi:bifunctional DNase/RNase
MGRELIQLTFDKIMQMRSYTVVVLEGKSKRFAIYTEPSVGKMIQMYLTNSARPRPLTHDLLNSLVQGFAIRVKQVVINDVQDTVYYARLFLEQEYGDIRHILEIDARPSDCITLALMSNAPVFCTREVLEKTIAVID